jgi:putative FmdB family regulatory protein
MPLYDYECKCGCEFEKQQAIADRKDAPCPKCGRSAVQVIKSGKPPGLSIFSPGWWRDIDLEPTYINNPQELRDACDKHNAVSEYLENGCFHTSPGPDPEHL